MALSTRDKSEVRRHLKYENIGFSPSSSIGGSGTLGVNMGYLATSEYGMLEQKMNTLEPCDEAALTGRAFASLFLSGFPALNDTVSLVFNNAPGLTSPLGGARTITITIGAGQVNNLGKLATQIALAVSQDSILSAAGFKAYSLDPAQRLSIANVKPFLLTASSTGSTGVIVEDNGSILPEPSAQVGKSAGVPILVRGYIPLLNYLYGAIASATTRLGMQQAESYKVRGDEVQQRIALYDFYRRDMANFLGIPLNGRTPNGGGYGTIII